MKLLFRLLAIFTLALLRCSTATAQLPTAPPPHLSFDEFVKEYKRLRLPLPPPNAELVRIQQVDGSPDRLDFKVLEKSRKAQRVLRASYKAVTPGPDAIAGAEPRWVSDWLCLAVQCHERGWNDFSRLLYSRACEAIMIPVPTRLREYSNFILGIQTRGVVRENGWELHLTDTSATNELRHVAYEYWHSQVMEPESDRKEALCHLKDLKPDGCLDIIDLELTLAPRQSKPGTVESLIDDLTDYWESDKRAFEPLNDKQRGEIAYRKLVELGFDAVPALLEHVNDERLTRSFHSEPGGIGFFGPLTHGVRTRVGHIVGQILNDLSGRELGNQEIFRDSGAQWLDTKKARAWWEKARKVGEEKWLISHVVYGPMGWEGEFRTSPTNGAIFRILGAKYPARLGELYRNVLRKQPECGSRALTDGIVASKLPRTEKLALLTEGAEHKQLPHQIAALVVLARFDEPTFQKHLLTTLKRFPSDFKREWLDRTHAELASLVCLTSDPACWDTLSSLTKRSSVEIRIEIIESFHWPAPDGDKSRQQELFRFLILFLSDDAAPRIPPGFGQEEEQLGERVQYVATKALANQLGLDLDFDPDRSSVSWLFIRAFVRQAAEKELASAKK